MRVVRDIIEFVRVFVFAYVTFGDRGGIKVPKLTFDESIVDQLDEVGATIVLKGLPGEQAYAYYYSAIPKPLRQFIASNDNLKLNLRPIEAIKANIMAYAAKNTNAETVWNNFVQATVGHNESVKEYCNRLIKFIRVARPNATEDDILFFIKPKLYDLLNSQVKPVSFIIRNARK